jgi:hypothetical protein
MKNIALYIVLLVCTTSCLSRYEVVDATSFNKTILRDLSIQNPAELMQLYIPYEGNSNTTIEWKELKEPGTYKITLTETDLKDDSLFGIKTIMYATYDQDTWFVTELHKQYKCWKGRGHKSWNGIKCN